MDEDKNWDSLIGIGIIIGLGVLVLSIIRQSQSVQQTGQPQIRYEHNISNTISGWQPLLKIPSIDDMADHKSEDIIPFQSSNLSTSNLSTSNLSISKSHYKNKETTEYVRDKDGYIIKKIVTRDAEINDR